jgi:hypothetical protein
LLKVWGGQIQFEQWVIEMLTKEWKSVVGLEQRVVNDFIKAQNVDSIDIIVIVSVAGWNGVWVVVIGANGIKIVRVFFIDTEYVLPESRQTMFLLQQWLTKTSVVVEGLGSATSCE